MCVTYPVLHPQGIVGRPVCVWCLCVFQTFHTGQHHTAVPFFRLEWGFIAMALPGPQIANVCRRVPISLTGELLSYLQYKFSI